MTVTFADPATDEQDEDLDFTVTIAPNTTKKKSSVPSPHLGLDRRYPHRRASGAV